MNKKFLICTFIFIYFMTNLSFGAENLEYNDQWRLYVNNNEIDNSEEVIISKNGYLAVPYISLRSFLESQGDSISWEKETGNIYFKFNGINYEICKANDYVYDGKDENTTPEFFEKSYIYIRNLDTNMLLDGNGDSVYGLYMKDNTSYLSNTAYEHLAKNSGVEYKFDALEKYVDIKKYNYTKEYILSNLSENVEYAQVIGLLGSADYFEIKDGKCIIGYYTKDCTVEMSFLPYSDTSDMILSDVYTVNKISNIVDSK